jgi:hypothetical protein
MHRILALSLLVLVGCGGPEVPRMPPLSVGSGGVRMMDEARTPAEAYENAFSKLTGCHNRVRSGLGSSSQRNYRDAGGALEEIAESLRVMRALVTDEAKPAYDPYIAAYAELAVDTSRDRAPANWQTRIDQGERDIKGKFSYVQAPIVSTWPRGWDRERRRRPPSKAASPIRLAARRGQGPEIPHPPSYKAWKQSHTISPGLQAGRCDGTTYADVQSSIAAMKQGSRGAPRRETRPALAVYEQQLARRREFSAIPARIEGSHSRSSTS